MSAALAAEGWFPFAFHRSFRVFPQPLQFGGSEPGWQRRQQVCHVLADCIRVSYYYGIKCKARRFDHNRNRSTVSTVPLLLLLYTGQRRHLDRAKDGRAQGGYWPLRRNPNLPEPTSKRALHLQRRASPTGPAATILPAKNASQSGWESPLQGSLSPPPEGQQTSLDHRRWLPGFGCPRLPLATSHGDEGQWKVFNCNFSVRGLNFGALYD